MSRVNITVPDEVLGRARAAGLNVSQLATAALAEELDRRAKIAELDRYLRDLDAELGPIPADDEDAARAWADAAFGDAGASGSGDASRSA
ncbi:type II toxin-antitoxin system CcdA family antitoxin [Microlunatus elymi]|nr:type II toxin-antitoxin system CcdA family antitoxin [Microlunatus elymi]